MTHPTRTRTSWLSKLFGRGPRKPIRRAPQRLLGVEYLEDRVVPATQFDFGGLRFVASNDFLVDPDGDYYAHEGTVQIGYTPAANESFLCLSRPPSSGTTRGRCSCTTFPTRTSSNCTTPRSNCCPRAGTPCRSRSTTGTPWTARRSPSPT